VASRVLCCAGQTLQSLTELVGGVGPFKNPHTASQISQPEVAAVVTPAVARKATRPRLPAT